MSESLDPSTRLRRLRATAGIRTMLTEISVEPRQLIQPIFVTEGENLEPIPSLPGINRIPLSQLAAKCQELLKLGIHGIAPFPKIDESKKSADGVEAHNSNNLALRAIREVKQKCPEMVIFADIALDPYTTHGHDGILNSAKTDVDNDKTVVALVKMSVLTAQAGADREPAVGERRRHHRQDAGAQGPWRQFLAGRFRHRLFVAVLPEAPAAGPAEDRSFVRARRADRPERRGDRAHGRRAGPEPGPFRHRRGCGDQRAARFSGRQRLPGLPGLSVQPPLAEGGIRGLRARRPHRSRLKSPLFLFGMIPP